MRKISLILVSFIVLVAGCATAPIASPGERSLREAEKCLKVGPCFVVRATNDGTVVSLNGGKIGEISAWGTATFFVRESALRDGRCAQVSVYTIPQGWRGQSDNQNRIWLVPRTGK